VALVLPGPAGCRILTIQQDWLIFISAGSQNQPIMKKSSPEIETVKFQKPADKKLLFEIIPLPEPKGKIRTTLHRHEFYEMMIILSGNTRQIVDFKPYNVKAKEILVISKGCLHQGDPKERIKGFTIIFAADFFSTEECEYLSQLEIFNASYNSSRIAFDAGGWSKIMTIFTALKQEHFSAARTPNKSTLRFLLLAFASKVNEYADRSDHSHPYQTDTVKSFFSLLERYFKESRDVGFYATRLNVTSKMLSQALLKATGMTASQAINNRLIIEAKRDLSFSGKSIEEIAFDLGFIDQLYFSRFFKKSASSTPQNFRKSNSLG
jgi:AraC family transcriptional activator of pobA